MPWRQACRRGRTGAEGRPEQGMALYDGGGGPPRTGGSTRDLRGLRDHAIDAFRGDEREYRNGRVERDPGEGTRP